MTSLSTDSDILAVLPASSPVYFVRSLVVDPLESGAAAVMKALGNRGHDAAWCASFQRAAEVVGTNPPDCLVVRLNQFTAPEAAELVHYARQNAPSCHILAITEREESGARMEAWLKRGFDDFIPDPASAGEAGLAGRMIIAEHALATRRERERIDGESLRHGRRYEDMFYRLPEPTIVVTARDGLIVEANTASEEVLGIPRAELVQRYLSLVLPDLFDRADYDPRVPSITSSVRMEDVRHTRPDGTPRWLDVQITRIPWVPGQAMLMQFHDMTLLRDRESRRVHDARMDAASRVMAGAARELSNALTSLQANLELLQRQPSPRQEARELLTAAATSANSAGALAQRLAALARAPMGGDLRRRPTQLKPLLERAAGFALLNGRAIPALSIPEDLWPAEVDEEALAAAVAAIVKNADDAMPSGGTVFVDAANFQEDSTSPMQVRIRIRDHGQGISSEHLSRIFDPWFTTRTGREGMGLALAAATLRAHGGHISIESQSGHGSIFTLWLPVPLRQPGDGKPVAALASGPMQLPAVVTAPSARRQRILFMDDDAAICSVVKKILTNHGFDVHCTHDGQGAIDAYRRARDFAAGFDLVLVDLDVRGGMGGQEAVARLKGEFPGIKALLTTGFVDDVLMETFRDHGFVGVLPKPFQLDRLVQTIGGILGVREC